jgi:hypothetical protein
VYHIFVGVSAAGAAAANADDDTAAASNIVVKNLYINRSPAKVVFVRARKD